MKIFIIAATLLYSGLVSLYAVDACMSSSVPVTPTRPPNIATEPSGNPDFLCPIRAAIDPCSCSQFRSMEGSTKWTTQVHCFGHRVTQIDIDKVFRYIRLVNDKAPFDLLSISHVTVENTNLTQVNLTPFLNLEMDELKMKDNPHLHRLSGPPVESNWGKIVAKKFIILDSHFLEDAGVGESLKYFLASRMTHLTISNCGLTGSLYRVEDSGRSGGGFEVEFLPGLASLTELTELVLSGNKQIERIRGGQFKRNYKLQNLYLSNLELSEVGENAFLFNHPPPPSRSSEGNLNGSSSSSPLTIFLWNNNLTDASFHPNFYGKNGQGASSSRGLVLSMWMNHFEFLSAAKFSPFLMAHPSNGFRVVNSPIICDGRMTWLKEGRENFENRVGVYCTNDGGESVFKTKLIWSSKPSSPCNAWSCGQ